MTAPDPGDKNPADKLPDQQSRRGRHWAPDDDDDVVAESDTLGVDSAAPTGRHGAPADDPAAGSRSGPRHAAAGSRFRLQPWMLAVIGVVVIGLIAWLVIGLATGGDDSAPDQPAAGDTSAATSGAATPVDPASLPQVLCMGQSYAMLNTGQTADQLLADPAAIEAQHPGSTVSTIPPGCIAGSDERDQVVLALGPFPTLDEACDAGTATGVPFDAYQGSASAGLELATCPA